MKEGLPFQSELGMPVDLKAWRWLDGNKNDMYRHSFEFVSKSSLGLLSRLRRAEIAQGFRKQFEPLAVKLLPKKKNRVKWVETPASMTSIENAPLHRRRLIVIYNGKMWATTGLKKPHI